jgi:predicted O-methyltransferase YrrM
MPGRFGTLLRYGILGLNRVARRALSGLAGQARKLEIKLDGVDGFVPAPLTDVPAPSIDFTAHDDPLPAILQDPRYRQAVDYFTRNASVARSLLSLDAQALLYILVRNLRPDHVIEIGVFKGATTEAIARALHANGHGTVDAVDPFRTEYIAAIFAQWPAALADRVKFHPRDSVQFFDELRHGDIHPSIALVDGNHEYPFAAFDIESAARILVRGGFIFVDNVTQPGPFFAVRDFLDRNPGWIECGGSTTGYDKSKAFDPARSRIPGTDVIILRAPQRLTISHRVWSTGQKRTSARRVSGVTISLAEPSGRGDLHVQLILRGFGARLAEIVDGTSTALKDASDRIEVPLAQSLALTGEYTVATIELCLIWDGDRPLTLAGAPEVF